MKTELVIEQFGQRVIKVEDTHVDLVVTEDLKQQNWQVLYQPHGAGTVAMISLNKDDVLHMCKMIQKVAEFDK